MSDILQKILTHKHMQLYPSMEEFINDIIDMIIAIENNPNIDQVLEQTVIILFHLSTSRQYYYLKNPKKKKKKIQ